MHAQRSIVLGKKSGLDNIDLKCKELGLSITPEQRTAVLAAVKKMAIAKRGLLTMKSFVKSCKDQPDTLASSQIRQLIVPRLAPCLCASVAIF